MSATLCDGQFFSCHLIALVVRVHSSNLDLYHCVAQGFYDSWQNLQGYGDGDQDRTATWLWYDTHLHAHIRIHMLHI